VFRNFIHKRVTKSVNGYELEIGGYDIDKEIPKG
jgi:hypothetical protein